MDRGEGQDGFGSQSLGQMSFCQRTLGQMSFGQIFRNEDGSRSLVSRDIVVKEDGFVNIFEIGRLKVEGLTQSQFEDLIYERMVEADGGKSRASHMTTLALFVEKENLSYEPSCFPPPNLHAPSHSHEHE